MEQNTILSIKNLSFTYPTNLIPSLEDISLDIIPGEFVVLCGASGSGKTTLLRHMKKNQIPFGESKGSVLYLGQEIETLPEKTAAAQIGFVGQNPESQLVTDKVYNELSFGLENLGVHPNIIRRKVAEIAQYFGISSWFRQDVATLSGGQKQVLNLASVMVMEPKVLLLDEPTSQLDPIQARRFVQTLIQLNEDFGTTILLSEQRLEQVLPLADRVWVLSEGKMIYDGHPKSLAKELISRQKKEDILPILDSLPTAMRVYIAGYEEEIYDESSKDLPAPVSIREGQAFLRNLTGGDVLKIGQMALDEQRDLSRDSSRNEKSRPALFSKQREKNEYALFARHLEYEYDRRKPILRDISLAVPKGKTYAVLGENGVGKTTLIKVLAGIYQKSGGKLATDLQKAYLPQNPIALFTELTVEEELRSMSTDITQLVQWLGLTPLLSHNPMDLSGGEQQRLALGKILLSKPDVLFLDEPTKGLDSVHKQRLGTLLGQLKQQGKTIVMVSHDLEFSVRNADYCDMLFDGELLGCDETKIFFQKNSFYTTQARKMAMGIYDDVLLWEDILGKLQERKGNQT